MNNQLIFNSFLVYNIQKKLDIRKLQACPAHLT